VSTAVLPKGQVTFQGLINVNFSAQTQPPVKNAITGGTGAYRDAGGFAVLEEGVNVNRATLHIDHLDNG
jgi:hypothetical protein